MENVKNIMIMVNQNLKVNIYMDKDMEKVKNIIKMVNQNLKVNIGMEIKFHNKFYYLFKIK